MKQFRNVISAHVRARGWLLVLLVIVLTSISATPGHALSGDPIDRTPEEEVEDISVPESYAPPANGFEWGMPSRFGQYKDGMIDYHWNTETREYDPSHIRPEGGFQVNFYGCATQADAEATAGETTLTYKWQVIGADGAATQTVEGRNCRWSPRFAEGTYKIRLTITPNLADQPEYYDQEVKVNDLFIVSIGDSYGSGEGNPDIPQKYDAYGFVSAGAKWQDKQCHRSAYAGAARAALGIEGSDPKSSVTFISLACSGATINARIYSGNQYEGSGVLEGYRGVDPPNPNDYSPASFLKPQIQALAEAANGREIDALVISGGGNDMHFADIIADCVWHNMPRVLGTGGRCHEQPEITDRLADDFELLPARYAALATVIHNPNPSDRPALNVKNVYLTEYPDPTADDDGSRCGSMLGEIIPTTPFDFAKVHIDADEANWARSSVVAPLNQAIEAAVNKQVTDHGRPWHFVTGVSTQYATHGYCADDHWVVQVYESARQQGPVWGTTTNWGPIFLLELKAQKGTMHPNRAGHMAYARQIQQSIQGAEGPGPSFSTADSAGGVTAKRGTNGWLTGRLDANGVHHSDKAVFSVRASDDSGIAGANITVNGGECADGIACDTKISEDGKSAIWDITVTRDGVYDLQLTARNRNGATSSLAHQLKVDLNDPTLPAASVADGATVGNAGWFRSNVTVKFPAPGPNAPRPDGAGSGVALVQYSSPSIENGEQFTSTYENGVEIRDDGIHTITYRVVDGAGRSSGTGTFDVKIDKTKPSAQCEQPDGLWHKDDVTLACTASDATSDLSNSATDASFNLATSVATGSETSDARTDTRTVCDVAGNCETAGPIGGNKVDKKAPEIALPTPASGSYLLNEPVAASFGCTDGGSGLASCQGTVADGASVDTASVGSKSFAVNASDNVGNTSTRMVEYEITYKIHALYDQTKARKLGAIIPVKLQLQDYHGANQSSTAIVVKATGLTKQDSTASTTIISDAGNANPDSNFRYDAALGGYIYNLQTTGLTAGTWRVNFTATADNVPHAVRFDVR